MTETPRFEGKSRASTVEDIFYPAEPQALKSQLAELMEGASGSPSRAWGIVAPCGAYRYSGAIAAAAFKAAAERKVQRVVLLGSVHREPSNEIHLPESTSFHTPLGAAPVDIQCLEELKSCSTCILPNDIPHLEEHCLEVQVPFIQFLFPKASLVPILLGRSSRRNVEILSRALLATFADSFASTLFVVSANLTGLLPKDRREAEAMRILDMINRFDWKNLAGESGKGGRGSCGSGCIAAILALVERFGKRVEILAQGCSADVVPEDPQHVHYAAVAFYED